MPKKPIKFVRSNSEDKEFTRLITEFNAILTADYGVNQTDYDEQNIFPEPIDIVILYLDDIAVGCGGFKHYDSITAEAKRVYLQSEYRGQGLGRSIMQEIEKWIIEKGYKDVILETGDLQYAAIELYKRMGYFEIDKYGPYVDSPASVCFKKNLK
jgi:GNAT superfamily N-acetyltransferase